jgi:hypothetical protein
MRGYGKLTSHRALHTAEAEGPYIPRDRSSRFPSSIDCLLHEDPWGPARSQQNSVSGKLQEEGPPRPAGD